jgi:shikimate kinase
MGKHPQNIFLIGPMGSGKTTIGKQVAKLLGLEFHDCDLELERQTGASINLIFDIEGEAGFREREHRMLDELTGKRGVLVATGGGVVGFDENRRLLRTRGFVVYLKTSVEQQLKRLSQDKSRPLLQARDRSQRLRALAAVRNPLYEATADLVFSSRRSSIYASARALAAAIREQLEHLQPEAFDANR